MEQKPVPEPEQSSGGANQKSSELTEEIGTPSPPPPQTEARSLGKISKLYVLWRVWWPRGKTAWLLFGEMVTLLWAVALWDSYRPKITITPGGTLNAKSPFGTYFIVQNQGALPISHVTYLTHLVILPPPGSTNQNFVSAEQNISVIPQMKSLETFTLGIRYPSVKVDMDPAAIANALTNPPPGTTTMQAGIITIRFDVSYQPKFFGKRTDTLYFFGEPDVDGNWQWLPSAHESVADQTIDTNLLPRVQPNPVPVATPTNGSSQVHTTQAKPN